ncbi:radical SAM protein [Psychrilyobacter atlanticus]|uniref:radical SAM protein n=1 Tax=Psychrilyobacter atlanticus TaxID=271091 RepID=UPI0003F73400|nr:radical SAM protein [Psychrilyobacter atlanticus]
MIKVLFYIKWAIDRVILKKRIPLNSSIILTDKCNLHCKHCIVANLGYPNYHFDSVKDDLKKLYNLGSRILIISGGEPFIWKDEIYDVEDVVSYAKKLGFFRVFICTNGTFELKSKADYLWVSMDGNEIEHNKLRGEVFSKVYRNILDSNHKNIYINFVISKINYKNFEESIKKILSIKKIKGILVHTFTPYVGLDRSLMLNFEEKQDVILRLLRLKKKHPFRILNTFDGLRALKSDKWERPVWGSVVMNQGQITNCCCREGIFDKYTCKNCGISISVEIYVLQRMKPLAILEYLRFL